MGTPVSAPNALPHTGAPHGGNATPIAPAPLLLSPEVAAAQPDGATMLPALNGQGEPAGLTLAPRFTQVTNTEESANASNATVHGLPQADTPQGLVSLPLDVLLNMLTFLTRRQLAVFEQTSKSMRDLVLTHEDQHEPARQALTGTREIDDSLWDGSLCWYRKELELAWNRHEQCCAVIPLDDESRMAQLEALKREAKQGTHALGLQCANQFGHIGVAVSDFGSEHPIRFLSDTFLDGLAASSFLRSIRLLLSAPDDEMNRAMIRLLDGLEARSGAGPLPLVYERRYEGSDLSDGCLKTVNRTFSSPALLPWEVKLDLAWQAELLMPALACASRLESMTLQFKCWNITDPLPLKGHEDCWPNLRKLRLQSNNGELPMDRMDWTAFMNAHPGLQDISLAAVQAPLARLLRTRLSINCDLRPENLEGLADELAATNSLRELRVTTWEMPDASELLRGLAHNKSIQNLELDLRVRHHQFDAKAWAAMIRGLKDHPGLCIVMLGFPHDDKDIKAACEALRKARPGMIVDLH